MKASCLIFICIFLAGCLGSQNIRTDHELNNSQSIDISCSAGEILVKLNDGSYSCKQEKELCEVNKKPIFEDDLSFKCVDTKRHSKQAPYLIYIVEGLIMLVIVM